MRRHLSIDLLRGVAILLMIQVHFVDNLSPREESSEWLYRTSAVLGLLPAPLFTLLSGLSFSLWMRNRQAKKESDDAITKVAVRRGLFLFGTGLALNFFVWFPEETFNWDVLTLLGASLLILAYARKLPCEVLALTCVLVVLLSPPLRAMSDYAEYWNEDAFEYDVTLQDVALGFVLNGYFPLLPWIVFPLTGFIIGETAPRPTAPARPWLAAIGLGLMALCAIGFLVRDSMPAPIAKFYLEGFTLNPASTEYVLGFLGFGMFSLALLRRTVDQSDDDAAPGTVFWFLQLWSVFSLTAYVAHHLAHLWPLWLYGLWMGQSDPTYYWRDAMGTPAAFGLAVAFVVLGTFALVFLERHRRYGLEAAMRWICD